MSFGNPTKKNSTIFEKEEKLEDSSGKFFINLNKINQN